MRRFRWSTDGRGRLCREGVGDCEAFLHGQLAERFEDRGVSVPTWAWTNLLAHGSEPDLRGDRCGSWTNGQSVNGQWHRARAYLATEVLSVAQAHGPLVVVQERLLRPLELDLAASPTAALWAPSQWATHVGSALQAHRDLARRTSRVGLHHQG